MDIQKINKILKIQTNGCSLPQAIRVVIGHLKKFYVNEEESFIYKKIEFKANPSLAFPKTELSQIYLKETNSGVKAYMVLNFMALFGSTSPIPTHYSEDVLNSIDNDYILSDFIDIFNHHLQKFIYPIWKKHRYYIQYQQNLEDRFSKYMLSILGFYSQFQKKTTILNFLKLMPYIAPLSMRQKSASTLVSIIRHYLSHNAVDIIQCIASKVSIDSSQYTFLGTKNCRLGKNTLIGQTVMSHTGKFRIRISNIEWKNLYNFSVLGQKIQELKELIQFALNEPLEYDVCLEVKKKQIKSYYLQPQPYFYLGINTWIGNPSGDEKIIFQ